MPRPNFVFIMTDSQGANLVGAYGQPDMRTPNLDQLSACGTRFENAYTTCPVCTPARAGIFTGLYPRTSGAFTNNVSLGTSIMTLGQRFQDAGYHTAYTGKWHLDGHDYFGTGVCPNGWDEAYWYDGKRHLDSLTDEEIYLWRSGLKTIEDLREHHIDASFTWAHHVSDKAIDFLSQSRSEEPFLLVVSYDEPHGPYTCPPKYIEPFLNFHYPLGPGALDSLENKPEHQRQWAESQRGHFNGEGYHNPLYFGCNSFVDAEIGRVIEAVDLYSPQDTYILYTSDHGDMMGAHRLHSKGPVMYEEITRIPLIIRQPGKGQSGVVDRTPLTHIDLLPTMLDLAGLEVPPFLHGQTRVPHLDGRQKDQDQAAFIEFNRHSLQHDSFGGFQPIRCIVHGPYKLVVNLLYTDELYDLEHDPAEVENRIHDSSLASERDQLHDELIAEIYRTNDPFRTQLWEQRPWRQSPLHLGWNGLYRASLPDGYAPPALLYDTGKPAY